MLDRGGKRMWGGGGGDGRNTSNVTRNYFIHDNFGMAKQIRGAGRIAKMQVAKDHMGGCLIFSSCFNPGTLNG